MTGNIFLLQFFSFLNFYFSHLIFSSCSPFIISHAWFFISNTLVSFRTPCPFTFLCLILRNEMCETKNPHSISHSTYAIFHISYPTSHFAQHILHFSFRISHFLFHTTYLSFSTFQFSFRTPSHTLFPITYFAQPICYFLFSTPHLLTSFLISSHFAHLFSHFAHYICSSYFEKWDVRN